MTTDGASAEAALPVDGDDVGWVDALVTVTMEMPADRLPRVPVTVTTEGAKFVALPAVGRTDGAVDDDSPVDDLRGQGSSTVDVTPLTTVSTVQTCPDGSADVVGAADAEAVRSGDRDRSELQVVSTADRDGVAGLGASEPDCGVAVNNVSIEDSVPVGVDVRLTGVIWTAVVGTPEMTDPTTMVASWSSELTSESGRALARDATTPDVREPTRAVFPEPTSPVRIWPSAPKGSAVGSAAEGNPGIRSVGTDSAKVVPGSSRLTTGIVARASETIEVTMDGNAAERLSAAGRLNDSTDTVAGTDTDGNIEVKLSTGGMEVGIGTGTIVGTETTDGTDGGKTLVSPPRVDSKVPTGFSPWLLVLGC